jgi:hypothetical protein
MIVPYRMLSLQCEYARKPESHKKEGIVPEAQRNRLSKRTACEWKINVNWPDEMDSPRITTVRDTHNHPIYDDFDTRILDKLTSNDIAVIERASLFNPKLSRRQIMEV